MQAPRTLAAALVSAALLMTSGLAMAGQKGHGHAPDSTPPGMSTPVAPDAGGGRHDIDNPGQPAAAPGAAKHGEPSGPPTIRDGNDAPPADFHPFTKNDTKSKSDSDADSAAGTQSVRGNQRFGADIDAIKDHKVSLKLDSGANKDFAVSDAVISALKVRANEKHLFFFSPDGINITAVAAQNESLSGKIAGITKDHVLVQFNNGQTMTLDLDAKAMHRLKLQNGSGVAVTILGERKERIVSIDRMRAVAKGRDWTSKYGKAKDKSKAVADTDATSNGCGKSSTGAHGRAYANQMAQYSRMAASGHFPPGLPHQCVNPAGHTRGWCKGGSSDVDCGSASSSGNDTEDVATTGQSGKCGEGTLSASGHGHAYDVQMAQYRRMAAKGQYPPGLPHQCINPAGNIRGWCKQRAAELDAECGGGGSESDVASATAPCDRDSLIAKAHSHAYDIQMAQYRRMAAKGQYPPGLPHQCINPAGNIRGWCKEKVAEVASGCGTSGGSESSSEVVQSGNAPGTVVASGPAVGGSSSSPVAAGVAPGRAGTPVGGHVPVGTVPVSGNAPVYVHGPIGAAAPVGGGAGGGVVAPASVAAAPARGTQVLAASTSPAQAQPTAAAITLARPLANTPCIWHKSAVAAASMRPSHRYYGYRPYHRVYAASYVPHHPAVKRFCH